MPIIPTMRGAAAIALLATAAVLQGCSAPDPTIVAQTQQSALPANTLSAGIYSGNDWAAALEAAMTSDNGGGD